MRIADVCGFYAPRGGGVRTYVEQKFAAALAHGYDLTVIAPAPEDGVEERPGGRIVWIESPAMPFDPAYCRFARAEPVWRALDRADPDIVEGSSPWFGGWLAGAWPGQAVRSLVFHQDFVAALPGTVLGGMLSAEAVDWLFLPYWAHLRRLSERFDVTVTSGVWLAERLAQFGVHRAVAAPFGVEPDRFSHALRDPALRRELLGCCGIGEGGRLLLAVGRLHREKQHRLLIEGVALARQWSETPLGLVIAGEGSLRPQLERQIERVSGAHLMGGVSDRELLARIYASADVLVHGSAAETYGLVVAEALASGLPVVAPAAGGAAELARSGHARLYAPGDAAAMAEALLDLLASEPPPRSARLPTAPEHFDALFSLYRRLRIEKAA